GEIAILMAQQSPPDALVLVATAARPMGVLLREQLARQLDAAQMKEVDRILAAIESGASPDPIPPALAPLFPASVRPFLKSQLGLDPLPPFEKLFVKIAMVQGEHDAQVPVEDALLLAKTRPDAKLTLVPRMNHVMKEEDSNALPQASYHDPARPLARGLVDAVALAVEAALSPGSAT